MREKPESPPPPYPASGVQQQHRQTSGYPGVVGGTPAEQRGVQGYDAYGQPITPAFMQQRYQIEASLGPSCPRGGYHELRMHNTNTTLLFAILILPYLCGWRGRREVNHCSFSILFNHYLMYMYGIVHSVYANDVVRGFRRLFFQNLIR